GACANIAKEYATKRYRSNCINWGMAPLLTATPEDYALGDWVFVPGIREAILSGRQAFDAYVVKADSSVKKTSVSTGALTEDERQIIADGCLINYYRNH
ncbi:MAG: hydratase, partial [Lachnospiraceae bacterium]